MIFVWHQASFKLSQQKEIACIAQATTRELKKRVKFRNLFEHSIVEWCAVQMEKIFDAFNISAMYGVENLKTATIFIYVHQKYLKSFKNWFQTEQLKTLNPVREKTVRRLDIIFRSFINEGFIESVISILPQLKIWMKIYAPRKNGRSCNTCKRHFNDFNNFLGIIRGYASLSMLHILRCEKLQKIFLLLKTRWTGLGLVAIANVRNKGK